MSDVQLSTLLPALFAQLDSEQRLSVLHIGAALPETVEFFSDYPSKLYFVDLFGELPISEDEEGGPSLREQFSGYLNLPQSARIDLCLFWDVFNFLERESITALLEVLRPHLAHDCLAHAFAVYNLRSPQGDQLYGISSRDALNVRTRSRRLPAYRPHPQSKLKALLDCFNIDRSVLLADSRLELLLSFKQRVN